MFLIITQSISPLAHHLHHVLKHVDFSRDCFCEHKLLDFCISIYSWNVYDFFSSIKSKLVYCCGSLLLKHVQGSRVIHFIMLAPLWISSFEPLDWGERELLHMNVPLILDSMIKVKCPSFTPTLGHDVISLIHPTKMPWTICDLGDI